MSLRFSGMTFTRLNSVDPAVKTNTGSGRGHHSGDRLNHGQRQMVDEQQAVLKFHLRGRSTEEINMGFTQSRGVAINH